MPPATTTSASPARISAAASMIALSPEPQTRLIVVALVPSGRPALRSACRAGAWPAPACRTWPIRTSSTGAVRRVEARSLDRGADRHATELGRGDRAQGPAEPADGRPGGADDEDGRRSGRSADSVMLRCYIAPGRGRISARGAGTRRSPVRSSGPGDRPSRGPRARAAAGRAPARGRPRGRA